MSLRDKYGWYNDDGYWIDDPEKWDYYAQKPKLYKRKRILAWCWMMIPIAGIIMTQQSFEEMGLSVI